MASRPAKTTLPASPTGSGSTRTLHFQAYQLRTLAYVHNHVWVGLAHVIQKGNAVALHRVDERRGNPLVADFGVTST